MALSKRFIQALDQATGERKIHAFLKKEPLLVWATFMNCGGHSDYVIPEFSLGSKYRTDFVVMQSFSGGWNVAFIELEPVDEEPFDRKTSNPSKRLRGAIKQVNDWRDFEMDEGATLRSQLADAAQKNDTLYPERNLAREPSCAKMPLRDPQTYLCCEYFIVMGRRSHFDDKLIHAKSKFARHSNNVKILTYDRFSEVAIKLEQQNRYSNYKNRTINEADRKFLAEFARDSSKFITSDSSSGKSQYPNQITVQGTCYKLELNDRGDGLIVNIIGTLYEIFEDRLTFNLYRVEPDGLVLSVAKNLDSLSTAIQLAEIYERFFYFHLDTKHSLDLVDGLLQSLIENPQYRWTSD